MTSRERVQAVLSGKKPDRLPFNFWMDRDLMARLDRELGSEFRITHYGADVLETFINYDWNCGFRPKYITDEKTSWQQSPALDDIEMLWDLKFPAVSKDTYKWIHNDRSRFPDAALFAMCSTPLDAFFGLRMMENAFIDFYENPEAVEHFFKEAGKAVTALVRGLKDCDIDVLYMAGDICSSKGLIMSPDMLRKYCFEPIREAIDEAHKIGKKVFYHSDGNLDDALPIYLEYGLDGINPLQPHVNDSAAFKKNYGGKLMLYGGIDNCFSIAGKTPGEVRRHILSQYEILGNDGGLIFSSHDIPGHASVESIDAMVDAIKSIKI